MAVIWGLDLHEIQWSKFKSSYMWNTTYHLRRTKFIVYQLAMILCVVSESLGTAVLSDYIDQEDYLRRQNPAAIEHNDDIVGIGSYNIFNGIYVATIFGAAFFFDLFWPERRESRAVRLAWKICAVLACVFCLASALALTVIVATHSAYVTGVPQSEANRLITDSGKHQSLVYHTNPRAVASAVFIWPGFVATVASCIILFLSQKHDDSYGVFSTHARTEKEMRDESIHTPEGAPVAPEHQPRSTV